MGEPKIMDTSSSKITCQTLPSFLSSFVDTFVDFSVSGGLFLLPPSQGQIPTPSSSEANSEVLTPLQTVYPSPTRLIAIGDLHGDLAKTKQALRLAGLINSEDRWCGGSTTVVQVGDILDRGGDELKIMYLFEKLKREASKTGGAILTMNGNHEIMNVEGDFRYVTRGGLEEFKDWAMWYSVGNNMKKLCCGFDGLIKDPFQGIPTECPYIKPEIFSGIRARIAALQPKGPIAERFLSRNQTVLVVGESLFVHGGLLPSHVEYGLEKVNEHVRNWILGIKKKVRDELIRGRHSIVWTRKFSHESAKDCDCSTLEHVLDTIPGVKRMIMGHTIQESGINGVCNNTAIRIDVGMSKGCGNGLAEVLEIGENSQIKILTSNPLYQKGSDSLVAAEKGRHDFFIPKQGPKQVEVNA